MQKFFNDWIAPFLIGAAVLSLIVGIVYFVTVTDVVVFIGVGVLVSLLSFGIGKIIMEMFRDVKIGTDWKKEEQ